ncbi:hypothetical protein P9112_007739 [Eukaryota sp. TZLM1-RC]
MADDFYLDVPQDSTSTQEFRSSTEQIPTDDLVEQLTGGSISGVVAKQVFDSKFGEVKALASRYSLGILHTHLDQEPKEVLYRLRDSFNPLRRNTSLLEAPDLYGPLMTVITLILFLNFAFISKGSFSLGMTKLGKSVGISLSFWLISTITLWFTFYLLQALTPMVLLASVTGYSMVSYCVIVLSWIGFRGTFLFPFLFLSVIISSSTLGRQLFEVHTDRSPAQNVGYIVGVAGAFVHFAFGLILVNMIL